VLEIASLLRESQRLRQHEPCSDVAATGRKQPGGVPHTRCAIVRAYSAAFAHVRSESAVGCSDWHIDEDDAHNFRETGLGYPAPLPELYFTPSRCISSYHPDCREESG